MLKKLFKFFAVLSIFVNGLCFYMLYKADYALQPIEPHRLTNKISRPPIYLISYADGHEVFYRNQNALATSAQNKGFDFIHNYRKEILETDFREQNKEILQIPTGAGLWLWKPQIILQTMQHAPENSIIVYTDVGFIYIRPIDDLIEKIGDSDIVLMNIDDYHTKEKLINWLPKQISQEWEIETLPEKERPKFIESGLIIVKNTQIAQNFIKKWLEICQRPEYAFIKYDKIEDDIRGFTYDQSLLSLIAYKFPDKVKILPKKEFKKWTVFHHRHPGNNKPLLPLQLLPAKEIREWIEEVCPAFFLYFGY